MNKKKKKKSQKSESESDEIYSNEKKKKKREKYLVDEDDEEPKEPKLKCGCKRNLNEKNIPYHMLSEHKTIPNKGKESTIKLYIKKKLETIKNMFFDINDVKNYKNEDGKKLTEDEKAKIFGLTDELQKIMFEKIEQHGIKLSETRTNKKIKKKKIIYYEENEEEEEI